MWDFLQQIYHWVEQVDYRFLSDAFLIALGFFVISILVLVVAQHNFNRPFHREVIRGSTSYYIVGMAGLVAILLAFAWFFSDVIFNVGLIDWYVAILVVLVVTPLLILLYWRMGNRILFSDEGITYYPSLYDKDVISIDFSDITYLEICNNHVLIGTGEDLEDAMFKFDKTTYGHLKDLRELLLSKVDPSIVTDNRRRSKFNPAPKQPNSGPIIRK